MKRRLEKDQTLRGRKYEATISDYIDKGYAERVNYDSDNSKQGRVQLQTERVIWYLPHHPVVHLQKPGKVRVVFDCAARYKGASLNEQLLQGPSFTNSLVGVIMRFRQEHFAIVADIEAMFHQVRVPVKDRDVLRFLWWKDGGLYPKSHWSTA